MRFKQFVKYQEGQYHPLNRIRKHISENVSKYIKRIIEEQIQSIGKQDLFGLYENDNLICSEIHGSDQKLMIEINSFCKINDKDFVYIDIKINDQDESLKIDPKFFRKDKIKNYLRKQESDIKEVFRDFRKTIREQEFHQ
jgi:hypothetical protein